MLKSTFLALFTCISLCLFAGKHTISGYVSDAKNGEKLIGANIYDKNTLKGVASNTYGFYSASFDEGPVKLVVSFIGYNSYVIDIDLTKDLTLNIELEPSIELDEVVVKGEKAGMKIESSQMSTIELPIKTLEKLPAFMGEPDIIKGVQMLPGVQSGSEGMSGMYVRGGGPDQNLILLDGVPVYNANHLFGFFSVFNPDAIQNAKLIKGGFPARYGGRLSSVLDISMKEGNTKNFQGTASIGIIASKITLEGPINDKASFIISGRRTYIDLLAYPFIKIVQNANDLDKISTGYYFYDLNAKINYKISDKSRLYLSTYTGKDKFYMNQKSTYSNAYDPYGNSISTSKSVEELKAGMWWGNITTALRWNYQINKKLFSNTTLTYSRYKMFTGIENYYQNKVLIEQEGKVYDFEENTTSSRQEMNYSSGIDDIAAKIDFNWYPSTNHDVKFGISDIEHLYNPGVMAYKEEENEEIESDVKKGNSKINTNEFEVYIEDDMKLGPRIKANAGLHLTAYTVRNKTFTSLQPRLSMRYKVNARMSVKLSAAQMDQNINLLTNTNVGLPTDLWVPATDKIEPMRAIQGAVGVTYVLPKGFEFSAEGFYKHMNGIVGYKDGATYFSSNNNWESKLDKGTGISYGLELLLMRSIGKTSGWIGYTWSKTDNAFPNQNQGQSYPYSYDRRHDLSIVLSHKLSDNKDIGFTWVFGSGYPTTIGAQQYPTLQDMKLNSENFHHTSTSYNNDYVYYDLVTNIEHKNNYRMPSYHRMDISLNTHKQKKWFKRTWSFAVYNVYNRLNPFYVDWGYKQKENTWKKVLYQYSLFPIIPSVAYKITF